MRHRVSADQYSARRARRSPKWPHLYSRRGYPQVQRGFVEARRVLRESDALRSPSRPRLLRRIPAPDRPRGSPQPLLALGTHRNLSPPAHAHRALELRRARKTHPRPHLGKAEHPRPRRPPLTVVQLRKFPQSLRQLRFQRSRPITPSPVSARGRRAIHPRLASQSQNVLHGNQDRIRHGSLQRSNECPIDLAAVGVEVPFGKIALALDVRRRPRAVGFAFALPPPHGRIVVMRSRVGYNRAWKIVRPERRRLWIGAEPELQDRHPRIAELVANRLHLRRNHAKIFRNERQLAHFFLRRAEQVRSRALYPSAIYGRLLGCRNCPIRLEASE